MAQLIRQSTTNCTKIEALSGTGKGCRAVNGIRGGRNRFKIGLSRKFGYSAAPDSPAIHRSEVKIPVTRARVWRVLQHGTYLVCCKTNGMTEERPAVYGVIILAVVLDTVDTHTFSMKTATQSPLLNSCVP
jgi:hypothetical protein